MTTRERFESWITKPPYERNVLRLTDDPHKTPRPGQYEDYETQLAWEAWQEAERQRDEQATLTDQQILAMLDEATVDMNNAFYDVPWAEDRLTRSRAAAIATVRACLAQVGVQTTGDGEQARTADKEHP